MKKKKQEPLNRFDPGTPASNAVDITTTLHYSNSANEEWQSRDILFTIAEYIVQCYP